MANAVFSCPRCGQALGELPASGVLIATCVSCRLKYEVVRGHLSGSISRKTEVQLQRQRFVQHYELRVDLPGGRTETVKFNAPENDAPMGVRPHDVISAVYLLRAGRREQLLSVHNATAGGEIIVSFPGDRAAEQAWKAAGAATCLTILVAGPMLDKPFGVSMLAAFVVLAGVRLSLGRLLSPRTAVSAGDATRLSGMQRLFAEKLKLDTARTRITRELAARRAIRDRLASLRAKMLNVGLELYQPRIALIDRALQIVDSQLDLQVRLHDGYERSIQMVEIELETGAAADVLDDAAAPHLAATLAEMQELETQQAELARQLSANAEVEALLKNPS